MLFDETLRPRRFLPWELRKVGVEIVDKDRSILRCMNCGHTWNASPPPDRLRQKNYWKCEFYCNGTEREFEILAKEHRRIEREEKIREERIKNHWLFKPKCQCNKTELQLRAYFT